MTAGSARKRGTGVAPLVAIFARGGLSARTGKILIVAYALSGASTVTARLTRTSSTLTTTVEGEAAAS